MCLFFVVVVAVSQIGSFQFEKPAASKVIVLKRRSAVKPVNAEPKRNDSVVPSAATIAAPGNILFCF